VTREGAFASVELFPLKRFLPLTTIYFSPQDEDAVIDTLSEHVPFEERHRALIDRFIRHIRF
jgi:hypothetical protein